MRASARLRAEAAADGALRLPVLRSDPPLVLRRTTSGVTLVAGAGGPLGGDHLVLDVDVGPGARLTVGSAAATVVQPDRTGAAASSEVTLCVAAGGALRWLLEPTVVTDGADLHSLTTIRCAPGGSLVWREVVALGRHGQAGGTATTTTVVDSDRPVLRQTLTIGARAPSGWDGPAVAGGHRVVGTVILLGELGEAAHASLPALHPDTVERVVLPLEAGGFAVTALGSSTVDVLRALQTRSCGARPGGWAP